MFSRIHIAALVLGLSLPSINHAQTDTNSSSNVQELEAVTVTAHPLADNGTAQSITVLSDDELAREVQSSLGETLSAEPGISSASFGTAVGRPIINGLSAARVKTTQDRICLLYTSPSPRDRG